MIQLNSKVTPSGAHLLESFQQPLPTGQEDFVFPVTQFALQEPPSSPPCLEV